MFVSFSKRTTHWQIDERHVIRHYTYIWLIGHAWVVSILFQNLTLFQGYFAVGHKVALRIAIAKQETVSVGQVPGFFCCVLLSAKNCCTLHSNNLEKSSPRKESRISTIIISITIRESMPFLLLQMLYFAIANKKSWVSQNVACNFENLLRYAHITSADRIAWMNEWSICICTTYIINRLNHIWDICELLKGLLCNLASAWRKWCYL